MKRTLKISLVAAAVTAALAATVFAQAPNQGPGFYGPMGGMQGDTMLAHP